MNPFPQSEDDEPFPSPRGNGNLCPRERLARRGARCLLDDELLAALLDTGAGGKIPPDVAAKTVLSAVDGSFYQLARWELSDFLNHGLTERRAENLVLAFEIGRRIEERVEKSAPLTCAADIFHYFEKKSLPLDREKCWVICTDVKNRVIRFDEVSAGTASASSYHPRDFLRPAVRANAPAIALVHNHPSGDSSPSKNDIKITKSLASACEILGIRLLDHVIVGRRNIPPHVCGYFAFSEAGLL